MKLAEAADQSSLPDGVKLPEEIRRREDGLAAIAAAKARIEARAAERFEPEQAEHQARLGAIHPIRTTCEERVVNSNFLVNILPSSDDEVDEVMVAIAYGSNFPNGSKSFRMVAASSFGDLADEG